MLLSNNYVNGYFYPRAYEMPVLKRYELKILILRVTKVFSSHAKKHVQFFSSLEHQCSVKNSVCHIKRASNDEDYNKQREQERRLWRLLDFDINWDIQRFWMDVMLGCHHGHLILHLLLNFFSFRILLLKTVTIWNVWYFYFKLA